MTALISKPGITNASMLAIPKTWDPSWWRGFVNSQLTGADVRNAVGTGGIKVSGTLASPYATIGFSAPVTLPSVVNVANASNVIGLDIFVNPTLSGALPVMGTWTGGAGGQAQVAIDIGNCSIMAHPNTGAAAGINQYLATNASYNGSVWTYKTTNGASIFQSGGVPSSRAFSWNDAPSGTVGTTVSFIEQMYMPPGGGLVLNAPSSGSVNTLQVTAHANFWAETIASPNTASQSFGLTVSAGTNSNDHCVLFQGANGHSYLDVQGGGMFVGNQSQAATGSFNGNTSGAGFFGTNNNWTLVLIGGATASQSDGILIESGTNGSDWCILGDNQAATKNLILIRGDGVCAFPTVGTTASAATCWIGTSTYPGQILIGTSSLRYKANVQTIQNADLELIMQMRPIQYTSLSEYDDPTTLHLGFIAEELDLIDKRLVQYSPSQYQRIAHPQGHNTTEPVPGCPQVPQTVNYDRITVLLVGAIQALTQRIAALEAAAASPSAPAVAAPVATITKNGAVGVTGSAVFTGPLVPITMP